MIAMGNSISYSLDCRNRNISMSNEEIAAQANGLMPGAESEPEEGEEPAEEQPVRTKEERIQEILDVLNGIE